MAVRPPSHISLLVPGGQGLPPSRNVDQCRNHAIRKRSQSLPDESAPESDVDPDASEVLANGSCATLFVSANR